MKLLIKLFIVLAFFESCCPKIIPVSEKITTKIDTIYKYRDTLIYVPPIYTTIKEFVNCDSLGAQLKKTVIRKNRITQTVEIKNGNLIAECNVDSLEFLIKLKDTQIKELTNYERTNNIEVFKMHGYEEFLFWSGCLFWLVLLGFGTALALKR